MKKILFASTALLMSAGVAAADVRVSGDGRMGIHYNGDDLNFTSRIRITFTASGQTSGGLSFGGSIRADNAGNGANGNGGNVFISGAFGRLAMGDVDSAAENLVGHVSNVGLTDLGNTHRTSYIGRGSADHDPVMLYTYTSGALTFAASLSDGNGHGGGGGLSAHAARSESWGVAVRYAFNGHTVAAGYESTGTNEQFAIGANLVFGDATVKLRYQDGDTAASTGWSASLDYKFGMTTVTVLYGDNDNFADPRIGLGVAHSLGGGAILRGGIVDNGVDTIADFGIALTF